MKKIAYYPGCTMKTTGAPAERTAHTVAKALGYELDELEKWNCCGTVFQLADDSIMQHVASVRNLIRAQDTGHNEITTLCAICYNTLRRVGELYNSDADKRERLTAFTDEEEDYQGGVRPRHFLELLDDNGALETLAKKVKRPLKGLKVMPYYGCLLLRPKELALDDKEHPQLMEKVLKTVGAEPVESPYRTECCGSYETVDRPEFVAERTYQIISDARQRGAQMIITACPLCQFNLDSRQRDVDELYTGFQKMPVMYFTQLLHIALGGSKKDVGFKEHYVNPRPVLKENEVI